jgi:hypothetical protein
MNFYFNFIIALFILTYKKWTLSIFVYPKFWMWGYEHIKPEDHWLKLDYINIGLGPLFRFYFVKTDLQEWLNRETNE